MCRLTYISFLQLHQGYCSFSENILHSFVRSSPMLVYLYPCHLASGVLEHRHMSACIIQTKPPLVFLMNHLPCRIVNLCTTDFNEDPHSNIKLRPDCLIRTDIRHPDQTLIFEVEEEEEGASEIKPVSVLALGQHRVRSRRRAQKLVRRMAVFHLTSLDLVAFSMRD